MRSSIILCIELLNSLVAVILLYKICSLFDISPMCLLHYYLKCVVSVEGQVFLGNSTNFV